jgi:hypothetical protein
MQIVITSYFFLEFPVVVVEIVEKLGEILREVEGWGLNVEVDRLMFGPWRGRFGNGIAGLGLGLRQCRARCEQSHDQHHRGPDGCSSAYGSIPT